MSLIDVFRNKARSLSKNFSRTDLKNEVFSTPEWRNVKGKIFSVYVSINTIGAVSAKPNACLKKLPSGNYDYVDPNNIPARPAVKKVSKKARNRLSRSYPNQGPDECYGRYVQYDYVITPSEQIPGLCMYLESEYERILAFVYTLFNVNNLERIPIILKKKKPCDTVENSDDFIAKKIKEAIDKQGENISQETILGILKKRTAAFPILGMYFSGNTDREPHIEIYYLNTNCSNQEEYFATLSGTLAHEFAHHAHCCYLENVCKKSVFSENTWNAKAVKESIADFSSFLWLISSDNNDRKAECAEHRYNSWNEWFGSSWPYAEALWYFYVNLTWHSPKFYGLNAGGAKVPAYYAEMVEKLRLVIRISTDMNNAYDELRQ